MILIRNSLNMIPIFYWEQFWLLNYTISIETIENVRNPSIEFNQTFEIRYDLWSL
jgi:hypothetical protein